MTEYPGKPGRKTQSGVTLPTATNEKSAGNENQPTGPEPPAYLDGCARAVWETWATSFEDLGIGVGDYPMVEAFCLSYQIMRESYEFLKGNGRKYKVEGSGLWKVWPEVSDMQKAVAEMRQIAPQLGFSPAARTKLPGPAAGDDRKKDKQQDFLNMLGM